MALDAAAKSNDRYDEHHKDVSFELGSLVFVHRDIIDNKLRKFSNVEICE